MVGLIQFSSRRKVPVVIKKNIDFGGLFFFCLDKRVLIRSSKKKKTKISIITDSSTDFSGSAPKRYTTTCYIQPMNVPYRYSETIFLKIETKKRSHKEKIFFKDEMIPIRWAETMSTEITTFPKNIMSEITIPVEDVFIELNPAA
nr:uncharacterized protein LOC111501947 isoform X1 [Leptinotarsa decemlineata]